MIKPAVLDAMVAAGCTAEQIAAAVKADQSAASGAERQRRFRERKAAEARNESDEHNVTPVTVTHKVSPKKEIPPTPPKEKTTPSNSAPVFGARTTADWFDEFWSLFPNKVGKRDAEKAFVKAVSRADPSIILAGLRRYVAKTDDRPWCNPATFLNQDRWEDAPAEAPIRQATAPPHLQMNDAIDRAIRGTSDAPFASPTIDASYERTDRRGAQNLVQFDAAAARFRS